MGSARQQQSQLRQHLGGEVAGGFPLEMGSYKGTDGDYFSVLPRFIEHLVDTTRSVNPSWRLLSSALSVFIRLLTTDYPLFVLIVGHSWRFLVRSGRRSCG